MSEDKIAAALANLREQYKANLSGRIELLKSAHASVLSGSLDAGLEHLHRELHKLAGSAGMYGYPELSDVARAAEYFVEPFMQQPATFVEHADEVATKMHSVFAEISRVLASS